MKTLTLTLKATTLALESNALARTQIADAPLPSMIAYKNPSCGGCSLWIEHVEEYGFETKTCTTKNTEALKDPLGMPMGLRSCDVATVDGYIIEGHVPADLIEKLLKERPDVAGLTVPGMAVGSPGMEGRNPQSYDDLTFTKDGKTSVCAKR